MTTPGEHQPALDQRVAIWTTLVGAVGFVVLAVALVPWDPIPGPPPEAATPGSVFTPQQIERAEGVARWSRLWSWSSLAVSLAATCWLGFGRWGEAIAAKLRGPKWWRVVALVGIVAMIGRLVTLPFAVALRHLQIDAGLTTSSWLTWTTDLIKSEAVGIVVTAVALVTLMACARTWRRAWPAIAGTVVAGLVVLGSFGYPLVVEPMFNSFTSLPEGQLRTEILKLAETEEVEVDDVLVADASRRTTTLNAYVSGFGSSRRVVVYDNLVTGVPEEETLSVVAHELAHAKHRDVVAGTALGAAGVLVGVGLLSLMLSRGQRRGRPGVLDPSSVPRILALVAIASLATAPIQNGISRQIETRADVVALESTADRTGSQRVFEDLQVQLALRSLADPTPPAWSQWWFGSHPTVLQRIGLARASTD